MTSRSDRPYDFIVFGATSFVGEILCRYLVERHGTDGDLAWAIAGRNEAKLAALAKATGADVARIVADTGVQTAVHCAGVSVRCGLADVEPADVAGELAAKVDGATALLAVPGLKRLVFFSSVPATWGAPGTCRSPASPSS